MTFRTARESFENAQKIAEAQEDDATALIAAGLADMAKTMTALKAKIDELERIVKRI